MKMGIGVETTGISKSYGGKPALSKVDIKVKAGELFAILGPSGSGKSTLLRILNLLEDPDGGEVNYVEAGKKFHDGEEVRRRMTLLLQRPVMLKDSVYNNVAYGLRLRGIAEKEMGTKIATALKDMGLEGFEKRRAATLSGGEMQRIAFARATILEPELLLLDEFTANLDPPNIKMLEAALVRYRERTGCTVVLVSHNPFQAQRLAKTGVFLYQGQVLGSGDLAKLQSSADERMAAFFRGDLI